MKIKQVKGIKYKLFEEDELREKLGMSEDNIKIVLDYQVKFPQLTQESDGFCINAENLRVALNMSKVLTAWIKPYTKEDNSYGFMENVDFTSFDADVNPTNGVHIKGYKLTLDMAKELCMISKSTEGKLCRKYFILIEKTLKDYEEWSKVRCPEKQEANNLKSELKKWASKNFMDFDSSAIYAREFNLLNRSLTGKSALELKSYINYKDKNTREHLETRVNQAIYELEKLDIMLLQCNKSYEDRMDMIETICNNQYKDIKEQFK